MILFDDCRDRYEMATSSNSNKRIRRSSTDSNNAKLHLLDLPDSLLVKTASYLQRISSISFAAMTQNLSSHEPSTLSKSIMTASQESWDSIDFKDVQDIYMDVVYQIMIYGGYYYVSTELTKSNH